MLEISRAKTKEFQLDYKEGELVETHPWLVQRAPQDQIKIMGVFHLVSSKGRLELLDWIYDTLKPGGQAIIQVPCWYNGRAYADPGVQWPPLSWEFFMLANKGMRDANIPYLDMHCDFSLAPPAFGYDNNDTFVALRNDETKAVLLSRNVNTATEIFMTLSKPA
jgi:hypothetical protein